MPSSPVAVALLLVTSAALAQTDAPPEMPEAAEPTSPPAAIEPMPAPIEPAPPVLRDAPVRLERPGFQISLDGDLRAEYSAFAPRLFGIKSESSERARANPYVGRNDGFGLGSARLNVRVAHGEDLYVRLSLDGAVSEYSDDEDTSGRLTTGLKDAYLRYRFAPEAVLSVGRFKPPYDVEELTPSESQYFVRRSLESRGVLRHEGWTGDVVGFAPGRQLGLMLASPDVGLGLPIALGYALAVTNGNQGESSLNDNDLPALYARLTFGLDASGPTGRRADEEGPATYGASRGLLIGIGGGVNQITTGAPPNRQEDRIYMAGADVAADYYGVAFRGQLLWSNTDHVNVDDAPAESALGGHAQVSVLIPGTPIAPGVRWAFYDPRRLSNVEPGVADYDAVNHVSIGLRIAPESVPLIALIDYTHSVEQEQRDIPNDRVEMALEVVFE